MDATDPAQALTLPALVSVRCGEHAAASAADPDADAAATTDTSDVECASDLRPSRDAAGTSSIGNAYPLWIQHNFGDARDVAMLMTSSSEMSIPMPHTSEGDADMCEECNKRLRVLHCTECDAALCFRCADAIHIVPSLATHRLTRELITATSIDSPRLIAEMPRGHPLVLPPPAVAPLDPLDVSAIDLASIERPTSLPLGSLVFFRAPDDDAHHRQRYRYGAIVSAAFATQSAAASMATSTSTASHYRVLWMRGIEQLGNGFFRASLELAAPWWPIEIGVYPTRLAAFRAVLTAERFARMRWRRSRVSSKPAIAAAPFPSTDVLDDVLAETEQILGEEFRVRLTHADDRAFLDAIARAQWDHNTWLRALGRGDQVEEEMATMHEQDETASDPCGNGEHLVWGIRDRMRLYLLDRDEVLLPDAFGRARLERVLRQMLFIYAGFAWQRWLAIVHAGRQRESEQRRRDAAAAIQRCRRRITQRREAEELAAKMENAQQLGRAAMAMDLFRRRQQQAEKLVAWLYKQQRERQRLVMQHWAQLAQLGDPAVQRRLHVSPSASATWHPSWGISGLPRLPSIAAHKAKDGSLCVADIKAFRTFRANHAGPTESSYWIVRQWILAGAVPLGAAFTDARRIVARADYTTSILLQQVGVLVCLLEGAELAQIMAMPDALPQQQQQSPSKVDTADVVDKEDAVDAARRQFESAIRAKRDALCVELTAALKMSKRQVQLAESELDDLSAQLQAPDPPPTAALQVQANAKLKAKAAPSRAELEEACRVLQSKLALARQNARTTAETLASLPPLSFVHFAMPRDGREPCAMDQLDVLLCCLEQHLRQRDKIYIFSRDAHGRTGVIAALLLSRLYGLEASDALERAQRLHDCQWRLQHVPSSRAISSPKSAAQIALVRQLIARDSDAIYAPLVVENSAARSYLQRAQQRGMPLEKCADRDGFLVAARPDADAQQKQQREHERVLRVGKRESAAARLASERQRQQREMCAMAGDEQWMRCWQSEQQQIEACLQWMVAQL